MTDIEELLVKPKTAEGPIQLSELTDAQLALIGGGIGEVIVG